MLGVSEVLGNGWSGVTMDIKEKRILGGAKLRTILSIILLANIVAFNVARSADRPLIGVLDIPDLFGAPTATGFPGADAPENPTLHLFDKPGDAESVRTVHDPARIEHEDIEYGRSGAIGYEKNSEGWFLVFDRGGEEAPSGYFWVSPESITQFKSYFSLIDGGIYLNHKWDRKVYPHIKRRSSAEVQEPPGAPLSKPTFWALPVESVTDANGKHWVLAVFFDMSECQSETGTIEVVGAGYAPAHLPNGEPTFVWATYC